MFENEVQTGDIWQDYLKQPVPCACCAPVIQQLNDLMAVSDTALGTVGHWQSRRPPLPPLATRVQILTNARVRTMNPDLPEADSIAFHDGKILGVGTRDELSKAHPDADHLDADGKTILPGFIEPHMHFLPIATIGRFEDVGPFRFPAVADALDHLKTIAAGTPADKWVVARQFDPSLQEGADQLDRHMLDNVSTEQAVLVYNASLHFAYCNSKALKLAGITAETPDLPGSSYGRDEHGVPNGVMQGGAALVSVAKHNPNQADFDLAEGCFNVCERANRVGVTTMCDQATGMGRGVKEIDIYKALAASGRMTTRLRYSLSYALQERWDQTDLAPGDGDELVRLTAWKIVSDGSNQGFSGLQRSPYLNSHEKGVAYVERDALIEMVKDRAGRGWPLCIHANGDQAIDNVLDAYEAANEAGLLTNPPYRIEHCSILHDEQIARIRALGLSPSFLIGHVYYWGKAMQDKVFGEEKAALLDRAAACEAAGIRWTLHSDEPVTEMGPLRCIQNAVTRDMWKSPGNKLAADEAVDVHAAIRSMTIDAAWQCRSDHEVGSLEPGKLADFVMLSADPYEVASDQIADIDVLETWMGGRKVYTLTE